jgi:aldehyde dehydrogenase (NAD+)
LNVRIKNSAVVDVLLVVKYVIHQERISFKNLEGFNMLLPEDVKFYVRKLENEREKILTILTRIETVKTAEDELQRAIACFRDLGLQFQFLSSGKVDSIASFLPLNQPLYSFVLFVIVPSFTSEKVFFIPPFLLWDLFVELAKVFEIATTETIIMYNVSRKVFLEKYVSQSDVVIFTGKYENALFVQKYLKKGALLLFNGGALNPIIITNSANIEIAVNDVIRERLFNSGQDCMAPCAILVERKISDIFLQMLFRDLDNEVIGENISPNTTVGQMIDVESLLFAKILIEKYCSNLIYGGGCDQKERIIEPTVFLFNSIQSLPQNLIFAPLFFIGIFDTFLEIEEYMSTSMAQDLNGYVSIYTDNMTDVDKIKIYHKQVLVNESLFVVESGNKEFGGYGKHCSFILKDGVYQIRPFLISKEIATAFY